MTSEAAPASGPGPKAAKRALRLELKRRIEAMDPRARAVEEAALAAGFATVPGYAAASAVLLYVTAFPDEVDTRPMLRRSLADGRRLILPRVEGKGPGSVLVLHEVRSLERDLTPGVLGILEPSASSPVVDPAEVDFALVPGLGFDRRGGRVGRGAGHYDRLLPRLRPGVPRWALILSTQWVDDLPIEPHDQPIDGAVDAATLLNPPA